jgi:hypothetical protein
VVCLQENLILLAVDWTETRKGDRLLAAAWGPSGGGRTTDEQHSRATIAVWRFQGGDGQPVSDARGHALHHSLNGLTPPQLISAFQPSALEDVKDPPAPPGALETIRNLCWANTPPEQLGLLAVCQLSTMWIIGVALEPASVDSVGVPERARLPERAPAVLCRVSSDIGAHGSSSNRGNWISCSWFPVAAPFTGAGAILALLLLSRYRVCVAVLTEDTAVTGSVGPRPTQPQYATACCELTQEELKAFVAGMKRTRGASGTDSDAKFSLPDTDKPDSDVQFGDFRAAVTLEAVEPADAAGQPARQLRVVMTTDSPALERSLFGAIQLQRLGGDAQPLGPADMRPAAVQGGAAIQLTGAAERAAGSAEEAVKVGEPKADEVLDLRGQFGGRGDSAAGALDAGGSASIPSFMLLGGGPQPQAGRAAADAQSASEDGRQEGGASNSCQLVLLELRLVPGAEEPWDLQLLRVTTAGPSDGRVQPAAAMEPHRWDLLTVRDTGAAGSAATSVFVGSTEADAELVWHFRLSSGLRAPSLHLAETHSLGVVAAANKMRLRGLQFCHRVQPQFLPLDSDAKPPKAVVGWLLILAGRPVEVAAGAMLLAHGRRPQSTASQSRGGLGLPGLTLSTGATRPLDTSLVMLALSACQPQEVNSAPSASIEAPEASLGVLGVVSGHQLAVSMTNTFANPSPPVVHSPRTVLILDGDHDLPDERSSAAHFMPAENVRADAAYRPKGKILSRMMEAETAAWVGSIVRSNSEAAMAACRQHGIDGLALLALCDDVPVEYAFQLLQSDLKVAALGDRLRLFRSVRGAA